MFFDTVTRLCQEKGITITALANELHISKSNVTNWKNGSIPKSDKVAKIAKYFNVSTDYLLGVEGEQKNTPSAELTAQERIRRLTEKYKDTEKLFDMFSQLSPERQKTTLDMIEAFVLQQQQEQKK